MSAPGPLGPGRSARIRWTASGGAVGLAVGLVGGLLAGGHLTVLGVSASVGVGGLVLTAAGLLGGHADRRYQRAKDQAEELERREERARVVAKEQEVEREQAAQRARDVEKAQRRVHEEASAVMLRVFGGGGVTADGFVQCQQVRFELINGTRLPISEIDVTVEPGVDFPHLAGDRPLSLVAGASGNWWQTTIPFAIPSDQAGGRPLLTRVGVVAFSLDGRRWRTRMGSPPELIRGELPNSP